MKTVKRKKTDRNDRIEQSKRAHSFYYNNRQVHALKEKSLRFQEQNPKNVSLKDGLNMPTANPVHNCFNTLVHTCKCGLLFRLLCGLSLE